MRLWHWRRYRDLGARNRAAALAHLDERVRPEGWNVEMDHRRTRVNRDGRQLVDSHGDISAGNHPIEPEAGGALHERSTRVDTAKHFRCGLREHYHAC